MCLLQKSNEHPIRDQDQEEAAEEEDGAEDIDFDEVLHGDHAEAVDDEVGHIFIGEQDSFGAGVDGVGQRGWGIDPCW